MDCYSKDSKMLCHQMRQTHFEMLRTKISESVIQTNDVAGVKGQRVGSCERDLQNTFSPGKIVKN